MNPQDMKDKAVIRFADGRMLKGFLREFSTDADSISVADEPSGAVHDVLIADLKAIFFVRSFEGKPGYRESKSYTSRKKKGQKIFIKFKDGENIIGYLEGTVPWEKGFFLTKKLQEKKGFYIYPVDDQSNNIRMFVINSAVQAVTVVP